MSFSSLRYKGSFSKGIAVQTNDPDQPNVRLMIKGEVLVPMQMSQERVVFSNVLREGPPVYETVTLYRGDGAEIQPEVLPTQESAVHAQICEITPGEHYELEIGLYPPLPNAPLREGLRIKTGIPEAPEITLLVSANFTPRLTAVPDRLSFPMERATAVSRVARFLWDKARGPGHILSAEANVPGATVEVQDSQAGQLLVVNIPRGTNTAGTGYHVSVRTDDPMVPTLTLPILFQNSPQLRAIPAGSAARATRLRPVARSANLKEQAAERKTQAAAPTLKPVGESKNE